MNENLFKRIEDVKQYTYLLERIKKEFREIKTALKTDDGGGVGKIFYALKMY